MKDNVFEKLKKGLPNIEENVLLKDHTTFKIGGPAEYFLLAESESELLGAIRLAKELGIDTFVMGGGSNLLVSDQGIKGLVVKNQVSDPIKLIGDDIVDASGGVVLGRVVDFSIENSLKGLEWAGGLPGSFGGAIRGNAGAFGDEIKDSIIEVRALDDQYNLKTLSNKECEFGYRASIFKQKNWVVLSGAVKLKGGDKAKIREISDAHIKYRNERHPLEYPNAGSIFKNVAFSEVEPKFQDEFRDKVKQDPFPIVPTAWFIIGAGLTGKQIGDAQISEKHSNYIVNKGNATAKDVLDLISFVQNKVKEKYNINLEPEVQFIGN